MPNNDHISRSSVLEALEKLYGKKDGSDYSVNCAITIVEDALAVTEEKARNQSVTERRKRTQLLPYNRIRKSSQSRKNRNITGASSRSENARDSKPSQILSLLKQYQTPEPIKESEIAGQWK